jgi:hypothetical protein
MVADEACAMFERGLPGLGTQLRSINTLCKYAVLVTTMPYGRTINMDPFFSRDVKIISRVPMQGAKRSRAAGHTRGTAQKPYEPPILSPPCQVTDPFVLRASG